MNVRSHRLPPIAALFAAAAALAVALALLISWSGRPLPLTGPTAPRLAPADLSGPAVLPATAAPQTVPATSAPVMDQSSASAPPGPTTHTASTPFPALEPKIDPAPSPAEGFWPGVGHRLPPPSIPPQN